MGEGGYDFLRDLIKPRNAVFRFVLLRHSEKPASEVA